MSGGQTSLSIVLLIPPRKPSSRCRSFWVSGRRSPIPSSRFSISGSDAAALVTVTWLKPSYLPLAIGASVLVISWFYLLWNTTAGELFPTIRFRSKATIAGIVQDAAPMLSLHAVLTGAYQVLDLALGRRTVAGVQTGNRLEESIILYAVWHWSPRRARSRTACRVTPKAAAAS